MDWPLFYRDSLLGGAGWGIKWPVQHRLSFYLDWPLYTGILCSGGAGWSGYKVASPTSTVVFSRVLPGLATLYRNSLLGGAGWGIKWLVQLSFFQWFYLDRPLYTGILCSGELDGAGIKWPVQHRLLFFQLFLTWIGNFIQVFSARGLCSGERDGAGIKWPVQHRL